MPSSIDVQALHGWCTIPTAELAARDDLRMKLEVLPDADAVHRRIADEMYAELSANVAAGRPTRWVIPCGPTGQYPYLIDRINADGLSLESLHVFHMDDFLDWQGRLVPPDHPFSMKGWMLRNFYGAIDADLNVPESQRHFPDPFDPDAHSAAIADVGGVDTVWGGIGYRGHVAFNEPPRSPWHTISVEEYRASKTRVVVLNDDTMVAMSQRAAGGCSHVVPPLGVTIGMADMLAARRIRLFSVTGAWKQTVVRVALFSPPTVEYPVTLVQEHDDVLLVVDEATAAPPLDGYGV
jgi:glucosamine-6-phosphate deaminase